MIKRKYADRSGWKRITKRDFTQSVLDSPEFKGIVTLLFMDQVSEPLFVNYDGKDICIVDDGYCWVQHFPTEKRFSLTTMFNANGEIVQWYIDICDRNGIENNIPWLDDLFLDIVVLPSGEVIQLDADELEDALADGIIDQHLYNSAYFEAERILRLIETKKFLLMNLAKEHRELLLQQIPQSK